MGWNVSELRDPDRLSDVATASGTFRYADLDGDGAVSRHEFADIYNMAQWCPAGMFRAAPVVFDNCHGGAGQEHVLIGRRAAEHGASYSLTTIMDIPANVYSLSASMRIPEGSGASLVVSDP